MCGQENREPKETVWGLVTHFFYDITHFDGKFFSTLKYLVFKPGFLPAEYIKGRRNSYLNPIRMYVFTSALFFIIFFSVFNPENIMESETTTTKLDSIATLNDSATAAIIGNPGLAAAFALAHSREDTLDILHDVAHFVDTVAVDPKDSTRKKKAVIYSRSDKDDSLTLAQYDSLQRSLPEKERDGWVKYTYTRRKIAIGEKYNHDQKAIMRAYATGFVHQFPKLLFVSLPLFALILRLLYVRRRKQFYYVDHGIFSIHLYIFSFILLLVVMGVSGLVNWTGQDWINWLQLPIWVYSVYYLYKAMRVFYKQRRAKTFIKFLLLNFLALITILILFVAFFFLTAFQI